LTRRTAKGSLSEKFNDTPTPKETTMSLKLTLAALLAALLAGSAAASIVPATEGAAPGEWTMDFDAAKALSAETGLPMILNFTGSDWCGWCKIMDAQVFSQDAWMAHAKDHFVLVWIDFPRDKSLVPEKFVAANEALMQRFGVQGFPTYFIVDSDGETILGQAGASRDATPESFIADLDTAVLSSEKSIAALREKMSDEQKAQLDAARSAAKEATEKLQAWIETQPERTEENIALFNGMNEAIAAADAEVVRLLKAAR
jgi:thioredoxin-related protein